MKKTYKEYEENLKYFLKNKIYISCIVIIAILCYGFYVTHLTIGVDDLTQDRYITGTYLLSQGRWGNVLTARILNITSFVPYWTETIATILLVFTTILLCSFIKKEIGYIVDKIVYYIIFSGILISYPVMHNMFLYNFSNMISPLSTIGMISIAIIIYENTFYLKNKNITIVMCLSMPFFISMYEASCQTFLVFIFIAFFINVIKKKKISRESIKFIKNCLLIMLAGIILNIIINWIIKNYLNLNGLLTEDVSAKRNVPWFKYDIKECMERIRKNVIEFLYSDMKKILYILTFFIISIITLIISIIKSIKCKKPIYAILNLCIILANFIISFIETEILYRTGTSLSITIAFMVLYIIVNSRNKKILKNWLVIISGFIILYNSKTLTSLFYNDYVRYEREKNIAYDIANTIARECENPKKPLIFIEDDAGNIQGNSINMDNGWSVLNWGLDAFDEKGVEITKFINSLGYNFNTATLDEYQEGIDEFEQIKDQYKKDFVIELDKYIIVKIISEPR